jgi:hypothetical protein
VRLDHLLSKEHLPSKDGLEPVLPECGGGVLDGGDTGESVTGNGRRIWYGQLWLVGKGLVVRLVAGG